MASANPRRSPDQEAAFDSELAQVGSVETRILIQRLDISEPILRAEIAEELGRRRYQPASSRLAQLLRDDRDALVRVCAAEALGELGVRDTYVIQALSAALVRDSKSLVRAYAAESLGRLGSAEQLPVLRERLTIEHNARTRASLLGGLSRLGDAEALDALLRMQRRVRNWELRIAILNILRSLATPHTATEISAAVQHAIGNDKALAAEIHWFFAALEELAKARS